MPPENKIQIVVEAYNMAKGTLDALGKQIKDLNAETVKGGAQSKSMLAGIKENWIAIGATVAGVAVVVNKALDLMAQGAKAEQAESAFRSVAAAAGESADDIISAMTRAAAGTVDDSDIMQKALKGMVQGLSGKQLVSIMEAARSAAIVSGQDVSQAYETITDAIANKMPRSLIQYGLVTKEQMKLVNEAMSLRITEIDVYALAMENAAKQQNLLSEAQTEHAEKMQRWKAIFNDVKETIGQGIFWIVDNVGGRLLNMISNLAAICADLFARMGYWWDWIKSGFKGGIAELNKQSAIADEALRGQIQENNAKYGSTTRTSLPKKAAPTTDATQELKNLIAAKKAKPEAQENPLKIASEWKKAQEAAINYKLSMIDIEEQERTVTKSEAVEKRIKLQNQLLTVQDGYNKKLIELGQEGTADWYAQQEAIAKTRHELLELNKALKEQTGTLSEGLDEGFKRYLDDIKTNFQAGVELAKQTAQAMEQAFSDFFFDAMMGKLKNFSDYIQSFLQAIARAIAQMMAQRSAAGIASAIGGIDWGSGSGGSGEVSFHQGGYVPRFHVGGLSSDERPAILQTGEYVVSRKGVAALDKINRGDSGGGLNLVVNVDNQTSTPIEAKNTGVKFDGEKYIMSIIFKNMDTNAGFRSALAGVKR